jgi:hypothetical protein
MSNAIGWSREDYEAAQAVNFSDGLHPVHPQQSQHYYQHNAPEPTDRGDETWRYQSWQNSQAQNSPTPPSLAKVASPSPIVAPPEPTHEIGPSKTEPRILGLRRTTFFLTVSNILLAIALVILGVVQSQVLRSEMGTATGSEAQGACPR